MACIKVKNLAGFCLQRAPRGWQREALGAKSLALLYPAVLGDGYQASVPGTNRKVHAQAPTCTEGRKGARNVAENKFLKKRFFKRRTATSNPEVSRHQSDLCITGERVYSHWG